MTDTNTKEALATDGISPGPWKVYPSGHSAPGYDVCDRIISDSWTGRSIGLHGMSDADARLIAAARDLLDVVRDLVTYGGGMEYDDYRMLVQRGEAAVAKATGEQS